MLNKQTVALVVIVLLVIGVGATIYYTLLYDKAPPLDRKKYHLECRENQCVKVEGEGQNECEVEEAECGIEDGDDEEFQFKPGDLNFVVILTDDQRADTIWAMPTVQKELVQKGFLFEKAFATTPLCCPSRSGLFTGFNAYNIQIMSNFPPKGGATEFLDTKTIAVELQRNGYETALMGKYLNDYFKTMAPYIPPGWDIFLDVEKGSWFNYDYVRGSSTSSASSTGQILHNTEYNTYFIRDEALKFIDDNTNKPFFLYWAPKAPHGPASAPPEDLDEFLDYKYDAPSLHETDISDKPEYVRNKKYEDEDDEKDKDREDFRIKQLQSIQAVDRSIQEIINKLEEKKILNKTVIIFASDNGYMWGEHGLWKKGQPYEESIHVPLIIRMPALQKGSTDEIVGMNIDIPTTVFWLAGIEKKTDGENLYELITTQDKKWRDGIVMQYWGNRPYNEGGKNKGTTDWAGYRTKSYKYVEYVTGEKEFYDLINDPYELENQVNNQAYNSKIQEFSKILEQNAGISLLESAPPQAQLESPYQYQFIAVWGKKPYKWYITDEEPYIGKKDVPAGVTCLKRLPEGLELTSDGKIKGTPTVKESCALIIAVEANSISPYTNTPHIYKIRLKMEVAHK